MIVTGGRRNIGVAVDFTACSKAALRWALASLARPGDRLVLGPVKGSFQYEHGVANLWEHKAHVEVVAKVYWGEPARKLTEAVHSVPLQWLVVGSRGIGAVKRVLMGSISTYVVNHATCPVTVVREKEHYFDLPDGCYHGLSNGWQAKQILHCSVLFFGFYRSWHLCTSWLPHQDTSTCYLLQVKGGSTDPDAFLSGWSPEADVCSWHGVTCLTGDGIAIGLNLPVRPIGDNIAGDRRPCLRRVYDLSSNSLAGEIPLELGTMQRLRTLLLHSNFLTGAIPPELGGLKNLKLSGAIPHQIGNLKQLQQLTLLSSLQSLNLANNRFSGEIPAEIGNLSSLTYLNLLGNRLTGGIPEELNQLSPAGFGLVQEQSFR
ncbi:hypothetical protein GUJ93_ZPchr0010g7327 [Zizania palustris]|uniref:Leucine-rich repeat-containing N-terminal plant-type domain-containing protein n=1 Tax=Zizania palustris TaxID=103762 RepID=A0A8J6BBB3_ZIZPA|nr:hypothetical protein GUJ93_ZPchr0010g7327 [Zizania palustris]